MRSVSRFFVSTKAVTMILLWLVVYSLPAQAQSFCVPLGSVLPVIQTYSLINSGSAGTFSGCFSGGLEAGGSYGVSVIEPTTANIDTITVRNAAGQLAGLHTNLEPGDGFGSLFVPNGGLYTFSVLASGPTFSGLTLRFESYAAPVPEPSTLALFAAGFGLIAAHATRRRQQQNQPLLRT